MRVYLAGTPGTKEREKGWQAILKTRLLSFWDIINDQFSVYDAFKLIMKRTKKDKVELFLDSGAFYDWNQKTEINIKDYISFIKEHEKAITVYANLDDITDPKKTYKNQKIMEKAGVNPIPVFHYGEDIKWLKKYLDQGYPYISLGGMVPISTKPLAKWLDDIFSNYLTDADGMPTCKVHGFGLTSLKLMLRYPWYSVDSTSWVVTGRMGSVYIPKKVNGKWDYGVDPWKITVSNRSPTVKDADQHISTFSPNKVKVITEYLNEKGYVVGSSEFKMVDQSHELASNEKWGEKKPKDKNAKRNLEVMLVEGISNRYQLRDELNIIYFVDLEETLPKWPSKFIKKQQRSLF